MTLGIILTILFLTLKLCHVIAWSWFYVFLPLILEVAFTVIAFRYVWSRFTGRFFGW